MKLMLSRRQAARVVAILMLAALPQLGGCSLQYHVYQADNVAHGSPRPGQNQPATYWEERTLHTGFWGLLRQDYPVDTCQDGTGQTWGLEEVRIRTNPFYVLASVATLGMWVPVKVGYRCARPCPPSPEL
jgi:hypothetical protein